MNYAPLLEDALHEEIPLTRAMGIEVEEASASIVRLSAPLAANDNHKGTAFGGSLYSLAVLSGWGLVWVNLQIKGIKAQVVIRSSQERFLKAAHRDMESECLADPRAIEAAFAGLEKRKLSGISLSTVVRSAGLVCMEFDGDYALMRK